jgi:hypothetical protein
VAKVELDIHLEASCPVRRTVRTNLFPSWVQGCGAVACLPRKCGPQQRVDLHCSPATQEG